MHAVATDAESFNRPCLYLQLDQEEGEQQQQEEDEEGEEGNAEQPLPELRLIPADDATRECPPASCGRGRCSLPDTATCCCFCRGCAGYPSHAHAHACDSPP